MNDFDGLLASEFGYKPQGKSAPMAPSKGSSNFSNSSSLNFDLGSRSARASNSNSMSSDFDADSVFGSSGSRKNRDAGGGFDDLFGGSAARSESRGGADSPFDLDSMFRGGSSSGGGDFGSRSANSPPPVYDKPVYDDDDDIFDGVPGLKSTSKAKYDDVFASVASSAPEGRGGGVGGGAFDDLLGGFGKESKSSGRRRSEKDDKGVPGFDDLLAGFGSSKPSSDRYIRTVCELFFGFGDYFAIGIVQLLAFMGLLNAQVYAYDVVALYRISQLILRVGETRDLVMWGNVFRCLNGRDQ